MQLTEFQHHELRACVQGKPSQVLFAAACGPLLYGFPHQSRYIDLRGVHLDPTHHLPCRGGMQETREWRETRGEVQIEWVSHEVGKFVRLLQVNNGGAYEQLFSPNVVAESAAFGELQALADQMLSQQLYVHYRSFFHSQLKFFLNQRDKHGRHLLYLYRVALTGIHLMEHGQLCASLPNLAHYHERATILQLLREMAEHGDVPVARTYLRELSALDERLSAAQSRTKLPEQVPNRDLAEAWLAKLRAQSADIGA
jgi:predicted nucleotidyltransferase